MRTKEQLRAASRERSRRYREKNREQRNARARAERASLKFESVEVQDFYRAQKRRYYLRSKARKIDHEQKRANGQFKLQACSLTHD